MNDWQRASIEGVWRRSNAIHADERGSFTELWRASLTGPLGSAAMVQANLSRSRAGVLRGMHFHLHQADLWLLIEGAATAALTDLRPTLAGGAARSETVAMQPGDALYIPPLVAHGFLAETDMALVYLVTNEYDATDEHGFAWDDPDAAIRWPAAPQTVSDRDRANPPLRDVIAALAQESHSPSA
jgi:dTDP-4-dehydrorhamnose 3,5-epimerase